MAPLTMLQLFEQALQHHQAGRLQQAEEIYRQIIALHPQYADAIHNLGAIAHQVGQNDSAVDLIRRAIALKPNYPEAYSNLGMVLKSQGQLNDAIAAFRYAISLNLNLPEPHINLGNALREIGQLDEAIATCRQAIALNPNSPEAFNNLGNALTDNGQLDEAITAFRQAITLRPDYAEAHNNLGTSLKDSGQLDEAITAYRQAIVLKPSYCDAHSNLVFALHYHPAYEAQAIGQESRLWDLQHAEPLKRFIQPHLNDRNPMRRLRIGYFSADFCSHASAFFLLPLLRHHDKNQFEVICYAQVANPDKLTQEMHDQVQSWHNTVGLTDAEVAAMIRQNQVDILVDLKLHTAKNRLQVFAHKPAPVQVTWLGYPGSTGLTAIDYRLSDPYIDPLGIDESVYSERTLRLPNSFWCYDPLGGEESR